MQDRTRGIAEMTAAMAISGTIGWFVVASNQPVLTVVFWRCVFGAVTLLAVCLALGLIRRDSLTRRQAIMAVLGGVAIVANWLLIFAAFSYTSISVATAIYNTQPFMLVGLGAALLGERLTLRKLGWLGLAFAGTLLIVQAKPQGDGGLGGGADYLIGIALALGAAFFYALAALAAKALTGVAPHLIALVHVGVGAVLLAPFAGLPQPPAEVSSWSLLLTIGIVHTGLMYILLYGAIQKLPTALTGALSFLYPLVAFTVDFVAFGQRLQPAQGIGAAAILLGAAGMTLGWGGGRLRPARSPRG